MSVGGSAQLCVNWSLVILHYLHVMITAVNVDFSTNIMKSLSNFIFSI